MHRKILALCAALVALGALLVAPAIASANPVLTETGVPLAVGSLVTGTGTNTCCSAWAVPKLHATTTGSQAKCTRTTQPKVSG